MTPALQAYHSVVEACPHVSELQPQVPEPLVRKPVRTHCRLTVVFILGRDGVLRVEVPEESDEVDAVQHGADAEVAMAAGVGVLVDESVRASDVPDINVAGDGVLVGRLGAREEAGLVECLL